MVRFMRSVIDLNVDWGRVTPNSEDFVSHSIGTRTVGSRAYEHDGLERILSVAYMALCCTRTYQLRRMDSFWNFSLETEKPGHVG